MSTARTMPTKGQKLLREAPSAIISKDAGKPIVCRISDESLDRYGTTLALDGWNLERFNANPVVLFGHNSWEPPVARAQNTRIEKDGLYSEPVFAPTEFARTVETLVREGFINATSVSWITEEWSYDEKNDVLRYLKQELLEWSFVPIPGNANALVQERAAAADMRPLREWAERAMRMADPEKARLLEQLARAGEAAKVFSFARGIGERRIELAAPTAKDLEQLVNASARAGYLAADKRDDGETEPETKPCPGCSQEMEPEAKYCSACGTKMDAEAAPAEEPKAEDDKPTELALDLAAITAAAAEAARKATA
jgi:HK97 family phage prohead protease